MLGIVICLILLLLVTAWIRRIHPCRLLVDKYTYEGLWITRALHPLFYPKTVSSMFQIALSYVKKD